MPGAMAGGRGPDGPVAAAGGRGPEGVTIGPPKVLGGCATGFVAGAIKPGPGGAPVATPGKPPGGPPGGPAVAYGRKVVGGEGLDQCEMR